MNKIMNLTELDVIILQYGRKKMNNIVNTKDIDVVFLQ